MYQDALSQGYTFAGPHLPLRLQPWIFQNAVSWVAYHEPTETQAASQVVPPLSLQQVAFILNSLKLSSTNHGSMEHSLHFARVLYTVSGFRLGQM